MEARWRVEECGKDVSKKKTLKMADKGIHMNASHDTNILYKMVIKKNHI